MAYMTKTFFTQYSCDEPQTKSIKLVQHKCPNCGAKLDIRQFVQDAERKYIKCDFCRSEFELCEDAE